MRSAKFYFKAQFIALVAILSTSSLLSQSNYVWDSTDTSGESFPTANAKRMFWYYDKGSFAVGMFENQGSNLIGDYSFSFGDRSNAIGNNSLAGGLLSKSEGYASIAIGRYAKTYSTDAIAFGYSADAVGESSIAIGGNALSAGAYAVAFGSGWNDGDTTYAGGMYSFAAGYMSNTNGNRNFAFGNYATTSNEGSVAFGMLARSTGAYSFASGDNIHASGNASFAANNSTYASGADSFAINTSTDALGESSFATGNNTKAVAKLSAVFGWQTEGHHLNSFVVGQNNLKETNINWDADDRPLFTVGNGFTDASRSNAFAVYRNGEVKVGSDGYGNLSVEKNITITSGTLDITSGTLTANGQTIVDSSGQVTGTVTGTVSGTVNTSSAATVGSLTVNDTRYTKITKLIGTPDEDYIKSVILLHEAYNGTNLGRNYAVGTLYATRGESGSFNRADTAEVNTAAAYQSTTGSVISTSNLNIKWKLVTLNYNGIKYLAIELPYNPAHYANGITFDGYHASTAPDSMSIVPYYNNNTNAVLHNEINSTIAEFTTYQNVYSDTSIYSISGKVGIGTTTPAVDTKLDVAGAIAVNGQTIINSSGTITGPINTTNSATVGSLTTSSTGTVTTKNLVINNGGTLTANGQIIVNSSGQVTGTINTTNTATVGALTASSASVGSLNVSGTSSLTGPVYTGTLNSSNIETSYLNVSTDATLAGMNFTSPGRIIAKSDTPANRQWAVDNANGNYRIFSDSLSDGTGASVQSVLTVEQNGPTILEGTVRLRTAQGGIGMGNFTAQ